MIVLTKEPGEPFRATEVEGVTLDMLQARVGGNVEKTTLGTAEHGRMIDLLFNEEGKYAGLPACVGLMHEDRLHDLVAGPVVVVAATRNGRWDGLTKEEIGTFLDMVTPYKLISHGGLVTVIKPAAWHGQEA
jgi:hypothetical protein